MSFHCSSLWLKPTNYTVVRAFITQNETKAAIEEALKIFRAWNPNWKPQYFMVDFCHEEINANI